MQIDETDKLGVGKGGLALPSEPLRVVLVALYWDYGQKQRGLSYEYCNLYLCLKEMCDVRLFDFYGRMLEKGKQEMNRELLALIRGERPDLVIFALFQDELIPEIIEELKRYTTTFGYFFDDSWRIDYVRRWTPRFNYVNAVTTSALRRHKDWGYDNVIYSPLGYNHFMYARKDLTKQYDVSFVGAFHGHRQWTIRQLRKAGINVAVWGMGWPAGRLTQEAMIDVFNQSKITLTLPNNLSWDVRYLLGSPRWALSDLRHCKKLRDQIKGRHFEVGGCGTFQMSYYVEDLEHCYEIGREIVVYNDVDDLIEKIRYYLKYEDERDAIAAAGYRRATSEHTYAGRFKEIVNRVFADRSVYAR